MDIPFPSYIMRIATIMVVSTKIKSHKTNVVALNTNNKYICKSYVQDYVNQTWYGTVSLLPPSHYVAYAMQCSSTKNIKWVVALNCECTAHWRFVVTGSQAARQQDKQSGESKDRSEQMSTMKNGHNYCHIIYVYVYKCNGNSSNTVGWRVWVLLSNAIHRLVHWNIVLYVVFRNSEQQAASWIGISNSCALQQHQMKKLPFACVCVCVRLRVTRAMAILYHICIEMVERAVKFIKYHIHQNAKEQTSLIKKKYAIWLCALSRLI